MLLKIRKENGFQYVEEGQGPTVILLHGLFGALSNFSSLFKSLADRYRVIIPLLPIFDEENKENSVDGLTQFVQSFLDFKQIDRCTLVGNSLGGHIGLVFSLENPDRVNALVLTGSSGLFESGMGSTYPRRGDYDFIKERVAYTFYSPEMASKALVDEVFEIVNDNSKTLKILKMARSAQRHNMRDEIGNIKVPTLLIWGLNDNITPPRVAHEFARLLPQAELHFIDKCGHAAMMEQPAAFNKILHQFLETHLEVIAQ